MSTITAPERVRPVRPDRPALTIVNRALRKACEIGPRALRISLAIVFVWFGALKLLGVSPVTELVAGAVPFVNPSWFVPMLGLIEVVLGVSLLVSAHPLVAVAMVAHLAGTFSVLVMTPEVAFQGINPLLLTTEGEFVMKNLVLVAAALAVIRPIRRRDAEPTV